jgi:hypothetical protein
MPGNWIMYYCCIWSRPNYLTNSLLFSPHILFFLIQETVREDLKASKEDDSVKRLIVGGICDPHRIDYFECLHSFKENQRMKKVADELTRQEYEAKYGRQADKQH